MSPVVFIVMMGKEGEPQEARIQIPITLNQASLGEANHVYMHIVGKNGVLITYGPRKDVEIDEQTPQEELTGKLWVTIKEDCGSYYICETTQDNDSCKIRIRVNKERKEIEPLRVEPVMSERVFF